MFFWRKRPPSRARLWRDFAKRLELEDASGSRARLCDLLDLPTEAAVKALQARRLGEGDELLFFEVEDERRGPAGRVLRLLSGCLFQSPRRLAPVSLRASPRLHPVLESLGASSSGGQRLSVPGQDSFNDKVTLYARDPAEAQALMTPAVCELLLRTLCERPAKPTLLVGEHHLVLLNRATPQEPTELETLEAFSSDLLGLVAAFEAATRAPD